MTRRDRPWPWASSSASCTNGVKLRLPQMTGVLICRFANGRVATCWAQADLLGLLCRLGVLPSLDLEKVVAVARVLQAGERLAEGPAP